MEGNSSRFITAIALEWALKECALASEVTGSRRHLPAALILTYCMTRTVACGRHGLSRAGPGVLANVAEGASVVLNGRLNYTLLPAGCSLWFLPPKLHFKIVLYEVGSFRWPVFWIQLFTLL